MSLVATIWTPGSLKVNLMEPVPAKVSALLQVSAFVTNNGAAPAGLLVPSPGDVHWWEIRDSMDKVLLSQPVMDYPQLDVKRSLAPGETVRADLTLDLDGKLLNHGQQHTIKFKFWGIACEEKFSVRVAK